MPLLHVNLTPPAGMSLFPWQYAAAANCSKCWRFAKRPESIAIVDRQQTRHDTDLKGLSKSKPLVWGVTGFALRKGAKNTGAVTQKNATVRGMMSIEIMDWDEGIGDSKQRKERKSTVPYISSPPAMASAVFPWREQG